jgi:hypothetical protein
MYIQVSKEGIPGFFGSIMSTNVGGPLESFEVKTAADGKVYAAVGSK